MIRLYTAMLILAGVLSFPLSVRADSSETTTTRSIPAETQSTRTTRSSGEPVVIQDAYGNSAIVQPSGTSTTIDTTTSHGGEMKEKTVVKKRSSPHHLVNFLGLKIL